MVTRCKLQCKGRTNILVRPFLYVIQMDERPFFNMLANELENSTGIEVPADLGKLNQRDCDELRKGYLLPACGKVPRRRDARLVDKNPLTMLWSPMIQRMFPRAGFILALRHPCDVIQSCYMQNFRAAVLAVAGQSLEHAGACVCRDDAQLAASRACLQAGCVRFALRGSDH